MHALRIFQLTPRLTLLAVVLMTSFEIAAQAQTTPTYTPAAQPGPKITFDGELDLGVTFDGGDGTSIDRPTELKFAPTLVDGNVGFYTRFLMYPPTLSPTIQATALSTDYAYGTYQLYGSLFDHFMTATIALGDFADLSDYVLSYNSNYFTNVLQGNPIGGYIEGLEGGEVAFSPFKALTIAVFVPWDNTGAGEPVDNTIGNTDGIVSYNLPNKIKIDIGYGNSFNGDISGTLVQVHSGTNLLFVNATLMTIPNLTVGAEYGNYTDVNTSSSVENYVTGTANYTLTNEESGNSFTLADDVFYFMPASGTSVVQEDFSTYYTFSQAFSAADFIIDMDVDYANNYPGVDSTNANSLVATDRNVTFSPWLKLSFGTKNDIFAVGYAYNYDIDAARTGYNRLIVSGTIYY